MIKYCCAHYIDASALVKLIADDVDEEPGRAVFREFYWKNTANVYASSFSVAESLNAFKSKYLRKRITESEYLRYIREFLRYIVGANLRIEDFPILSLEIVSDAERMVPSYGIDFLDCIQISTIKHGQFKYLDLISRPILITADRGLAKAARAEGVKVWECTSEPAPVDGLAYMVNSAPEGL